MPKVWCVCGAKYRFEDKAIGQRARCKRCGEVFVVEAEGAGSIPLEPMPQSFVEEAVERSTLTAAEARQQAALEAGAKEHLLIPIEAAPAVADRPFSLRIQGATAYVRDIFASVLFLSDPGSLGAFMFLWLCFGIAKFGMWFGGLFSLMAAILLMGFYYAYCMETIAHAAAGEDALPKVALTEGMVDGMLFPLFRWLGVWLVIVLPGFAAYHIAYAYGVVPGESLGFALTLITLFVSGVSGLVEVVQDCTIAVVLLVAGQVAWPMLILCVALGGFSTLYRPDLMFITFIRTLPMYAITVGLVNLHLAAGYLALRYAPMPGTLTGFAWYMVLMWGALIYFNLFAMRAIGLYYHHFKGRFAWNWG